MKRSSLPRRKTPLKRGKPPCSKGGHRYKAYEPNRAYQDWIRGHPCAIAGHPLHHCLGLIQFCHVKSRGAGGVDEGNGVPLCTQAHAAQHILGIVSFQRRYEYDMQGDAERLWAEYQDLAR